MLEYTSFVLHCSIITYFSTSPIPLIWDKMCRLCMAKKSLCFISQALPHQTREHNLTFDISLIFPLCISFVILVRLRSKFISSLVSLILWSLVRCCHIDKKRGITQSFNSTLSKKNRSELFPFRSFKIKTIIQLLHYVKTFWPSWENFYLGLYQ